MYYDRRDVTVLYLFVEGSYVGEAYCTQFMGARVSEWEAKAIQKHDKIQESEAREAGRQARTRTQEEAKVSRKRRAAQIRASEQSREYDRQRQEIHPVSVLERLEALEERPKAGLIPPPAVPDAEPDRPVRVPRVRNRREEPTP